MGDQHGIGIAELAQRAGVTPRTIRYYVAEGLLPPPGGRGQRRAYTQEHLDRLAAIRELKAAYLPLHEIRRRLAAPSNPPLPSTSPPSSSSPPPRTGEGLGVGAPIAAVASQPPTGFGGSPGVGRIEIYDPPETVWRRHTLAPGVELHYRETADPDLAAAIRRLIREAAAILDGRSRPRGP